MAQLPSQSQFGDYGEWPGRDVLDSGGERLGGVREIYLDRETGRPEWVLVDVDSDEARFVPLADASVESSTIRVAHTADAIRSAPGIGSEPRIDESEERRLYAHYGLGYSEAESGSGLPEDVPTREHEQRASGPTPTAWGAPDSAGEEGATPTGWGEAKAETDPTTASGTEDDASAPFTATEQGETPDPLATPAKAEAPTDPWGAANAAEPEASTATPPLRTETEEPETSWSAVGDPEPTNLAPPPAEPPSVEELESADIPEPSTDTGRADEAPAFAATTEPEPELDDTFTPSAGGPIDDPIVLSAPDDVVAPSAGGEILAVGAGAVPEAELTAQPGPDTVRVFTPPEPPRIHSVPPSPREEPPGTGVSGLAERKLTIVAGVAIALILLFMIRRRR
jgi:hypothetical protein